MVYDQAMNIPLKNVKMILTGLGYKVTSYQTQQGRRYFVERGRLAIRYGLPIGTLPGQAIGIDLEELKVFCATAITNVQIRRADMVFCAANVSEPA